MHKQVVLILLILVCSLHASFANAKAPTALAYQGRHFIANSGQMDASIVYYADTNLGRLYVRQHDLVLQFIEPAAKTERSGPSRLDFVKQSNNCKKDRPKDRKISNIYVSFPGSDFSKVVARNKATTYYNFMRSGRPEGWITNVPAYYTLCIKNIYANVDLVLDIRMQKGSLWRLVRRGNGPIACCLDVVFSSSCTVTQEDSETRFATCRGPAYLANPGKVCNQPLIDCHIAHKEAFAGGWGVQEFLGGTYVGGSGYDFLGCFPVADSAGNIVFLGTTNSQNIPVPKGFDDTFNGAQDFYIAKLTPGFDDMLWATYLGGHHSEISKAIIAAADDTIVIAGISSSPGLATPGAYNETYNNQLNFYIARLNASGDQLLAATYIGHCTSAGKPQGLAATSQGNIVVGGSTEAENMPVPNGFDTTYSGSMDMYVAMLSADFSDLLWGTYIGGSHYEVLGDIAIDCQDNIYVVGETNSNDIYIHNAYDSDLNSEDPDCYIAKLSATDCSIFWATYFGGNDWDSAEDIVINRWNQLIVSCISRSTDIIFPYTFNSHCNGEPGDVMVFSFTDTGQELLWGGFIGGTAIDVGLDICLDNLQRIIVGGYSESEDFPVVYGYDDTYNGSQVNGFIFQLAPSGDALCWSTYFGGNDDNSDAIIGLLVDANNNVIFGVVTDSNDLPTSANAFDPSYNGNIDFYVGKLGQPFPNDYRFVYRFFNTTRAGHLYTISDHERVTVQETLPYYSYEGPKFVVMANAHEGLSPVYRFFNTQTGIHLYTISEYERDYILANLPHYSYEGAKFYVYSPGIHPQETTAVYRFFNTRDGGHLYTISEFERNYIMDNLQHYNYEGIKFYVYTKPEFTQPDGNVNM